PERVLRAQTVAQLAAREVRLASAGTDQPAELGRVESGRKVLRHLDHKLVSADNGYDPRLHELEVPIGVGRELGRIRGVDALGDVVDLPVPDVHAIPALQARRARLVVGLFHLALRGLDLGAQGGHARGELLGRRVERPRQLLQQLAVVADEAVRRLAHHQVDAAQPLPDARLGDDHRGAHISAVRDVRAPAELTRPVAEAHDADDVSVLLFEEVHRTIRDGLAIRLLSLVERQRLADLLHHALVDTRDLLRRHSAVERDVERRVVGADPGALLHDVLAESLAQRLVQQVGRRVMARDRAAPLRVHRRGRLLSGADRAPIDRADVRDHALGGTLRVLDADAASRERDHPGVADLAAGLAVERRPLEEDLYRLALRRRLDSAAVDPQCGDGGGGAELAIAGELRTRQVLGLGEPVRDGAARTLALRGHRGAESLLVDLDTALVRELARELERKAERVVEP